MMLTRHRFAALILASLVALFLVACSSDDDDKDKKDDAQPKTTPEFITTPRGGPGGLPTMGSAPPPVIIGSGPGTTSLTIGPIGPSIVGSSSVTRAASAGLTVRHLETATLPADQAFVVAQLQNVSSGPGPFSAGLSGRQQEQVTTALTGIGVKKEDINFETNASYGPFASISVPVEVKDLQTRGRQIIDAIETATGSRPQSGARFAISDCRVALDPLRKKAIEATNEEAKALAAATSVTLGPIRAVSQTLSQGSGYSGPASDPCSSGSSSGPKPPGTLLALDADPRVTLNLQIEATYGIGTGDVEGGLTVSGSGKATAKADEAYIVVTVYSCSGGGPFGPQPISKKTRDELLAKLKALNFDEDDIQIETGINGPSQTIVSVDAPITDLQKNGKDVVAAVEDVLGRSQTQGVWWSHSNCTAVLNEARKQAVADAKRSAEALAGSASVKLGDLTALAEGSTPLPTPYASLATTDPCTENVAGLFNTGGGPYGSAGLKPFDSTAEFTVSSSVSVTYALAP